MVTGWLLPRRSSTQKVARLLSALSARCAKRACALRRGRPALWRRLQPPRLVRMDHEQTNGPMPCPP